MNKSILFFFIICYFSTLTAQSDFITKDNLKGNVLMAFESTIEPTGYRRTGVPISKTDKHINSKVTYFNSAGLPEVERVIIDNHQILQQDSLFYEGEKISQKNIYHRYVEKPIREYYSYDKRGNLINIVRLIEEDTVSHIIHTYQRNNITSSKIWTLQYGMKIFYEDSYKDGFVDQRNLFDENHQLILTNIFSYQKDGNISRTEQRNPEGDIMKTTQNEYEYDAQGNWIKRTEKRYASGETRVTKRIIQYHDTALNSDWEGQWMSGDERFALEVYPDNTVSVYDLKERVGGKGKWRIDDNDKYSVTITELTPITMSHFLNNNKRLNVEIMDGMLRFHNDRSQEEMLFFPMATAHIAPYMLPAIQRMLWETSTTKSRWNRSSTGSNPKKYEHLAAAYDNFKLLTNELAVASLDGKYCLYHLSGTQVTDFTYDYIRWAHPGLLQVQRGDLYGIVNTQGEEVLPVEFQSIRMNWAGMIGAVKDNKAGVYNQDGHQVIPHEHEKMNMFAFDRIQTERDHSFSMFDFQGNTIIPYGTYRSILPVEPNLFLAKTDSRQYTLIDSMGQVFFSSPYVLREAKYGYFTAINEFQELALMNFQGELLSAFYDQLKFCEKPEEYTDVCSGINFANAVAIFRKGASWGYLNGLGQEVLPKFPAYGFLEYFYDTVEKDDFSLKYTNSWKITEYNNTITSDKYNDSTVRYTYLNRSEIHPNQEGYVASKIGEYDVWVKVQHSVYSWEKIVLFPLDDERFLQLRFQSALNTLLQVGQSFSEIEQSVVIKN